MERNDGSVVCPEDTRAGTSYDLYFEETKNLFKRTGTQNLSSFILKRENKKYPVGDQIISQKYNPPLKHRHK